MRVLAFIPIILLAACASPDVSSFKQSTLALTSGLTDGQTALVADSEAIAREMADPSRLMSRIQRLKADESQVKEVTAVLSAYAVSVANLAQSGEKGADAARSMLGNITSAVGNVSGASPKLPGIFDPLTTALGVVVQQDKNKKLHLVMTDIKPEIDKFADELGALHNSEDGLVNALEDYWIKTRKDLMVYHNSYVQLEQQMAIVQSNAANTVNSAALSCSGSCDYAQMLADHKAKLAVTNKQLSELQAMLNAIQPYEDSYQALAAKIAIWKTKAKVRIARIPDMAAAWKRDHQAIISYLASCTGTSSIFKSQCGAFSAGNLELFGVLLGRAAFPF
jgi:vacuolar-type H+-ATPase catalytic subunit A/Vma1